MILTLKQDSKRFESEAAQKRRQFGQAGRYAQEVQVTRSPNASPGMSYGASATFDDRQRMGRPDAPQSGYAGYGMDTSMEDIDDDRGPVRGYRDQDPRMDGRMDARMEARMEARQEARQDFRQDQRQQPPISRHGQIPPGYPGFAQDPTYLPQAYQVQPAVSGSFDQAGSQPRTLGPNNTPPPNMVRGGQPMYPPGYPVATSAGYSIPTTAAAGGTARYAETTNGRVMVNYPGGATYAPDRHATARR
jgi:hypothetical protein